MTDAERLDYLEQIMRARIGFVDVNMSGVRQPDGEAYSFFIDLPGKAKAGAVTLRDAIDAIEKLYPRKRT